MSRRVTSDLTCMCISVHFAFVFLLNLTEGPDVSGGVV